jgi:16S rRNA (guanine527-N7)-methyltransferase
LIDSNYIKNSKLTDLNVSREALIDLKEFRSSIISRNKEINLISESTEKSINTRHIEDSLQTIDFINKKDIQICTDLGSGAGLPGIVLAIFMKYKNPLFKVIFYEKSFHKSNFLKEMSKKFKLNTEIYQNFRNCFKKF